MIRKLNCLLLFFISLPALSQEQGQPCYFLFKEKNQITQKVEIKINLAPIEVYRDQVLRTNFSSFEEAQAIVQKAGIKTSIEYKKRYKELGLPSNPYVTYKAQGWSGWRDFLGTGRIKRKNFLSLEEAQALVQKAEIKTLREYKKRYKELGRLPSAPNATYKDQGWKGWNDFLGTERIRLVTGRITRTNFLNFEEARQIVQEAGIKTNIEYQKRYKELGRLPSEPNFIYIHQGWKGWRDFLGTKDNFLSFKEAQTIVQKAGIKTSIEYKKRYKELERLPSEPNFIYIHQGWKGWRDFLGTEGIKRKNFSRTKFLSFEKAKQIVQEAGIKTSIEYKKRYKELGRLPSAPNATYKAQGWKGWRDFLGTKDNFLNFKEAQTIVQKAGIKTNIEYKKRYKELGRLPSEPNFIYIHQGWKGWRDFLGTKDNFLSFKEAQTIVQKAGIKTNIEYKKRYKELGRLPSEPNFIYIHQGWKGWRDFLGTKDNFLSFKEAQTIVQKAGIKTSIEYKKRYKELERLPSEPNFIYIHQGWKGWKHFLGTEKSQKNS